MRIDSFFSYRSLTRLLLSLSLLAGCAQAPAAAPSPAVPPASTLPAAPAPTAAPSPSRTPTTAPSPTLTAPSPNPSPTPTTAGIDLSPLLDPGADWFVLVKDLRSGQILYHSQPSRRFHPASMIKVPLAAAVLRTLEARGLGIDSLNRENIDGRTLAQLLRAAVVVSEEPAAESLLAYLKQQGDPHAPLRAWGLADTAFEPRRATAFELADLLERLYAGSLLEPAFTDYLLDLMAEPTPNDATLLGTLKENAPEAVFYNKRGTLTSPTILADMGIFLHGERALILVICGTPKADGSVTYESIQESIEQVGSRLGD